MTFAHEAVSALPVSGPYDAAAIRALLTRRVAYVLASSEDAQEFVAVDPDAGTLPIYLIQNGSLFELDSTDTTTAHDGVTCLVSSDGKRYKTGAATYPWSVSSRATSAQPVSPTAGDRYLVPAAATGTDWSGQDHKVAIYTAAGWFFAVVPIGRPLYVDDETAFYHRNASGDWTAGVGSLVFASNSVRPSHIVNVGRFFIVENQTTNTPPGSPSVGVAYIIGSSPSGAWSGKAGQIALCEVASAWTYYVPAAGWQAYDKALDTALRYSGSSWIAGADAKVLIATKVASSSATIDFVHGVSGVVLDDTYDSYELVISSLKAATDDVEVRLRVGTGAGPTWQTSGYRYAFNGLSDGGTAVGSSSTSAAQINLGVSTTSTSGLGNAAGKHYSARIEFDNPDASDYPMFRFSGAYIFSAAVGLIAFAGGGGMRGTAAAITGIRILLESGNIAAGRFSLYGLRKS